MTILKVALPLPLYRLFDYLPLPKQPIEEYWVGMRVQVPFGQRQMVGFVVEIVNTTHIATHSLKSITASLDNKPILTDTLFKLLKWVSDYYHSPLGETLMTALPAVLRRNKPPKKLKTTPLTSHDLIQDAFLEEKAIPQLTEEQGYAVQYIQKNTHQFKVFLLEGVTGSGKTEVYLRLIQSMLDIGKQVLLLVPEINLTPQMLSRIQSRFPKDTIALFHSGLTDSRRFENWKWVQSAQAKIMIGTRSAVFAPFPSLGLIILDEEHDGSFKQQSGLQYHARDVAIMRAHLENIPILLGSATPSLETLSNVKKGRYHKLILSKRPGASTLPMISLMDVRNQRLTSGLSEALLHEIKSHLDRKEQVLLFLNRRGFAPVYLCHGCGWISHCLHCDSPLHLHRHPHRLRCHYCDYAIAVPHLCPSCHQSQLFPLGHGTQKLEKILSEYFPSIQQIRIDADSTRGKNRLADVMSSIPIDKPAILIGTQMIAKGHHFPNVTLAAVVDGDAGLFGADFRSLEQAAQLITQVAGRAGRANKAGHVIIQTHYPHHPLLKELLELGYASFSQSALVERQQARWPPFSYLALLRTQARTQSSALAFLNKVKADLSTRCNVTILGPVPSLLARRSGYYRAQLLFQSSHRPALHKALDCLVEYLENSPKKSVRWSLDVDPLEVC
jgi:primosomal protein N' (replication factor Y)